MILDLLTAKNKLDESQKQLETLQLQLSQLRIESSKAKGINGDQTDNSMLAAGAAYIFTSPVINTNNTFLPTVIR